MDAPTIRARLIEAIKALPALEQQVMQLRYPEPGAEEACSFREIAAIVHLPEDRVQAIFHRAIEKVRAITGDSLS